MSFGNKITEDIIKLSSILSVFSKKLYKTGNYFFLKYLEEFPSVAFGPGDFLVSKFLY